MISGRRFRIVYHARLKSHLRAIDRRHHSLIREAIESQLTFEPDVETRNRKPLRDPLVFGGAWEIRFGPGNQFRVFYDIHRSALEVNILAIGQKRGNRLFIAGEEI